MQNHWIRKILITAAWMIVASILLQLPQNTVIKVKSIEDQVNRTYIIDAGHGGEDGGAVSNSGLYESQINLEIAIKIDALFKLMGCSTIMIRSNDSDLHSEGRTIRQRKQSDLANRVKIANSIPNGFLISIHQNFFQEQKYHGMQVFYRNPSSKQHAEAIQKEYAAHIYPASRRLAQKKTGVYLMDNAKCDAVLVECGFLSNPEEEALLQSKEYQCKISSVIVTSILAVTQY
jgi:N-acetylmuramoyl-L-alanine amidase